MAGIILKQDIPGNFSATPEVICGSVITVNYICIILRNIRPYILYSFSKKIINFHIL